MRSHSTDPIGPQTQQTQPSQYSEDRGNAISTLATDAAIQAGQCAKGLVPDVNSLPLWSEVGHSDRSAEDRGTQPTC